MIAVSRIIAIVLSTQIFDPTVIKILISIIGIKIKIKNIIQWVTLNFLAEYLFQFYFQILLDAYKH